MRSISSTVTVSAVPVVELRCLRRRMPRDLLRVLEGFRFYSLSDKVWRDDVLVVAWQAVRRNGGTAGVDGETVADIESFGVDRWLGVLERRTEGNPSIRHYAVCDIKCKQADRLRNLGRNHPSFRVYEGDANERVHEMLEGAPITAKTACFCLIDQRTFQCHWTTVEAVAQYKREGYKIELFYFLAQK